MERRVLARAPEYIGNDGELTGPKGRLIEYRRVRLAQDSAGFGDRGRHSLVARDHHARLQALHQPVDFAAVDIGHAVRSG